MPKKPNDSPEYDLIPTSAPGEAINPPESVAATELPRAARDGRHDAYGGAHRMLEQRVSNLEREMAHQAGVSQLKAHVDQFARDISAFQNNGEANSSRLSQRLDGLNSQLASIISRLNRLDGGYDPSKIDNLPSVTS